MKVLSKSRFKTGLSCPNKLYFSGDKSFKNKEDNNTFLATLAEGGFQVEALARLSYPGGHFVDAPYGAYEKAYKQTLELLNQDEVVIYEAAFLYDGLFVMTDILVKKGNHVRLIEVKAKSFDSTQTGTFIGTRGDIRSSWRPYLFDIAFQTYVAKKCIPEFHFEAFFLMADKSKVATIDGLNQMFRLPDNGDIRKDVEVKISAEEVQKTSVLSEVNVTEIVNAIIADEHQYSDDLCFSKAVPLLRNSYQNHSYLNWPTNYSRCKSCEFKIDSDSKKAGFKSGFEFCFSKQHNWTETDFTRPNVFEIWNFRGQKLLEENRLFLNELKKEDFKVIDEPDAMSSRERRWVQVQKRLEINPEPFVEREGLKKEMDKWLFPLHFIDFETSAVALPFNKGRHPYEQVAFQFSHHMCHADGTIEHVSEYINANPGEFPNFKFVAALKKSLDNDQGTIFRFATHENSILNAIKDQLNFSDYAEKGELIRFIKTITTPRLKDTDHWIPKRPMVDLRLIILDYYYNPLTKGSNSIKAVLPAILNSCNFLKNKYSKPISEINLTSINFDDQHLWIQIKDQKVINPYKLLPPIFNQFGKEELEHFISGLDTISDGGAALTAYSKLQFVDMSKKERDSIKKSLFKYCELDTLAMVMIYEHLKTLI
ncbi:DUF2779 domain-containing protein [Polaribacter sp.]|nr:DUF2779 domain-containing protein [Polaribacter sp.]